VMADISDEEVTITRNKLKRVRERVLQAEKNKLHMDNPIGAVNDIEEIIREEIE
jgi:hypothetical protein